MVTKKIERPALGRIIVPSSYRFSEVGRRKSLHLNEIEIHRQMKLVFISAKHFAKGVNVAIASLSNQDTIAAIAIKYPPELPQNIVHLF